jgi:hypothetical protein
VAVSAMTVAKGLIFESVCSRAEYAMSRALRLAQEAAIIAGISIARFLVCPG